MKNAYDTCTQLLDILFAHFTLFLIRNLLETLIIIRVV